jgi:predicted ribosomally synthesized peptide with SipW-like signal peptide
MDKKILVSMMVIGLVAALAGAGLYAYFSDTETSKGNKFTAGTMDLKLSDIDETWADGVIATWESPDNWAPGQIVTAELHIKNDGSIGAYWLYIGISALTDGLSDQIHITEFVIEEYWSGYNHVGWMATTWGPWSTEAPLTLAEFGQYVGTSTPYGFMACGDDWTGTYDPSASKILPAGGEITLRMTFLFNPDAGNDYQGKSCSFDLKVSIWNGYPSAYTEVGTYGPGY